MNILLDAFYDLNYGDDLFIETITGLFPKCKFYSFLEYYPPRVIEKAQQIANLYLLPECGAFLKKNMFDAYICVGGDVFPDGGDYTKRKAYVRSVKECHGVVAFWGFSLFHDYCEQTQKDLVETMKDADVIAPRDEKSAEVLRQLMPEKEISAIADLAFLSQWKQGTAGNCLGISVRRPNYASDEDMAQYTARLQDAICAYLKENENGRVKIFSLSSGNTSDEAVTQAILDGVAEKDRVEHIIYAGDTSLIKEEISKCDVMICTRLHGMISCIAMNIPFIPVVYEVKMDHILEEIGYRGQIIRFQDIGNAEIGLDGAVDAFRKGSLWDKEAERKYINHTQGVMEKLRYLLRYEGPGEQIFKVDMSGPVCEDREHVAATYQGALNQRNADVKNLEEALHLRAKDVETLENALRQREKDVATLENALAAANAELQEIKATWQYRATAKVNRMLHKP